MLVNMIGRRQTATLLVLLALAALACSLSGAARDHHQDHRRRHQDSARRRHHRELGPRGEQIKSSRPAKWRSNPLIEWGSNSLDDDSSSSSNFNFNSNRTDDDDFCSQARAECAKAAGQTRNERDEKLHPPIDREPICASDGRLYRSVCQLKRRSCRAQRRLSMRPRQFCRDTSDGPTSDLNGEEGWDDEEEEACESAGYERFKWLLWRHHHQDLARLFGALDRNSDGWIEAHELWPRADGSSGCQVEDDGQEEDCSEFPFEPQFPPNPCSLSHLMLFELRPPNKRLDLETIRLAFGEQLELQQQQQQQQLALAPHTVWQTVELELGQSTLLTCPHRPDIGYGLTEAQVECTWSRYNVSLADGPHLSLAGPRSLRIADAQLHLSGPYRCACQSVARDEHLYYVQVSGGPRVELRPKFQWALPNSRANFQCHHDHIETGPAAANLSGARIRWLMRPDGDTSTELELANDNNNNLGRLNLERLKANQSGHYICQVEVATGGNGSRVGRDQARLLVQEAPWVAQNSERSWLWMFHDEGVSVYKLQPEEQEMVLAGEISGHQQVSAQVDGNWNQLTLCGGLNPEQVVICEWSDNAVYLEVKAHNRSYVYVGQPNLNRVIVFDALALELVAIINTEPQPRRLHPYRPRQVRLSKWARRRLGLWRRPAGGPQWAPIEQHDIWLLCYGQPLVVDPTGAEDAGDRPFAPLISTGPGWWPAGRDELRSRRSVHVIQSTFLAPIHHHHNTNLSGAGLFKASSWLQTRHVGAGSPRTNFEPIQELYVPARPYAMQPAQRHKLAEAYLARRRRLLGLSMEELRFERDIDLHDCDPIHLLASAQGSLVIQCQGPNQSDEPRGQLLLDQLTGARLAFDNQVRAQVAYLSPDHRYLISVYTAPAEPERRQSIVYVQSVRVGALKLEYEIKTSSLEISQCAFVWKDGYYAAIFVSLNKRDQQSEILSLRLADGRLELMARVPGLVAPGAAAAAAASRKEQLVVSPELRLAALSTSQGTYVVDLEDNRVSQSLRRHQSLPTLLWASSRH